MSGIEAAVAALERGEPIVIPTDTVYGIAARPDVGGAARTIFDLKGRPDDKALPVLGPGLERLTAVAAFDRRARALAERHWPGPLTLVLPRDPGFTADLGGGDSSSVAVRVPGHRLALDLLDRSGPLAVTSANRSGREPATTATVARATFGDEVAVYLDGGPAAGVVSTVLELLDVPRVLREGAIPGDRLFEDLEMRS